MGGTEMGRPCTDSTVAWSLDTAVLVSYCKITLGHQYFAALMTGNGSSCLQDMVSRSGLNQAEQCNSFSESYILGGCTD